MASHNTNTQLVAVLVFALTVTLLSLAYYLYLLRERGLGYDDDHMPLATDSQHCELCEVESPSNRYYHFDRASGPFYSRPIEIHAPQDDDDNDHDNVPMILVGSYTSQKLQMEDDDEEPEYEDYEMEAGPLGEEEEDLVSVLTSSTTSTSQQRVGRTVRTRLSTGVLGTIRYFSPNVKRTGGVLPGSPSDNTTLSASTPCSSVSKQQRRLERLQRLTNEFIIVIDDFIRSRDDFYAPGYFYNIHRLYTLVPPPPSLNLKTIKDFTAFLKVQSCEFKVTSDHKAVELLTLTPCREEGVLCEGYFHCVNNYCGHRWISYDSFANEYNLCEKCSTRVYPYRQTPLQQV